MNNALRALIAIAIPPAIILAIFIVVVTWDMLGRAFGHDRVESVISGLFLWSLFSAAIYFGGREIKRSN